MPPGMYHALLQPRLQLSKKQRLPAAVFAETAPTCCPCDLAVVADILTTSAWCCLLQAGLTPDELVLKATRAWNIAVRQRGERDEQLWLDFAAFQHVAARLVQQQRGRYLCRVSVGRPCSCANESPGQGLHRLGKCVAVEAAKGHNFWASRNHRTLHLIVKFMPWFDGTASCARALLHAHSSAEALLYNTTCH